MNTTVICITEPVANGTLHLQDGPSLNEGRLEIRYKDFYGAVCNDTFGDSEAATACHQLGFAGAERVVSYGQRLNNETWLDDVDCNSGDVWLYNCTHKGWGVEDFHSLEAVGVKCNGTPHIHVATVVWCIQLHYYLLLLYVCTTLCM